MKNKIRYAVVGLGHIAQDAVLPGFRNSKNSVLTALVSGNRNKLSKIGKQYQVAHQYFYQDYEKCLSSGEIDAVYIALPNDQHHEFAIKAAHAGIHVLCEKPMALSVFQCKEMIKTAENNKVKLMIAYRLHFEEANLGAIDIVESKKIGVSRAFNSIFTMPVKERGIRLNPRSQGGGPVYDIGIYCINAARSIFRAEPTEVMALAIQSEKRPFKNIEEGMAVSLKFPGERMANFVCSFGCASVSNYQILGTKGNLSVQEAYHYQGKKKHLLTIQGKTKTKEFSERDQFGPELSYFSECILKNRKPEPSGEEGLADIRVIDAIFRSSESNKAVSINPFVKNERPSAEQERKEPKIQAKELVEAEKPSNKEAA